MGITDERMNKLAQRATYTAHGDGRAHVLAHESSDSNPDGRHVFITYGDLVAAIQLLQEASPQRVEVLGHLDPNDLDEEQLAASHVRDNWYLLTYEQLADLLDV